MSQSLTKETLKQICKAANIYLNLGRKACAGYVRNNGLDASLVRLAIQLEAGNRAFMR